MVKSGMTGSRSTQRTSPIWHIQLLGALRAQRGSTHNLYLPFPVEDESVVVLDRFQTQKTSLLLTILALNPDKPQYREDLIARLWPETEPAVGRDRLSQALSWLRRHLETDAGLPARSLLLANRYVVQVVPDTVTTDVLHFDAFLRKARSTKGRAELTLLEQALNLYKGPLLPGLADQERWLFVERQRLIALYEETLRRVVSLCESEGQPDRAITYCRRLLREDPEDENACGQVMRLLAQTGDVPAALREYAAFAGGPGREDEKPPSWLKQLASELQQRRFATPPRTPISSAPERKTSARSVLSLPLTLARFFGREAEMELLLARLEKRERLLTLLGPGGSGKTRLAIELARRFAESSQDINTDGDCAAFFVPLEGITEARQILPTVYRTVRQSSLTGREGEEDTQGIKLREDTGTLRDALARLLDAVPRTLVVLDNYEQLADDRESSRTVADLLQRTSGLSLIVTSRRALGIEGEQHLMVSALPTPKPSYLPSSNAAFGEDPLLGYASVRMFLDRAQRVRIDFALTSENRTTLSELCTRLEGIPLAIELCAAWAALLTPEQMLGDLKERFQFLVSRRQDIPARHRTMYAAIESSYLQMSREEQRFFTRLSVFRNGWFAAAADTVLAQGEEMPTAGAARSLLAALQERSLIVADASGTGTLPMRYRMLETLREFAWEQLADSERDAVSARHATYFVQTAEMTSRQMTGPEQRRWLDLMESDGDNLRTALAFFDRPLSEASQSEEERKVSAMSGLRLCVALTRFWQIRGYLREGREQLEFFLRHFSASTTNSDMLLGARGQSALGQLTWAQGDFTAARKAQETALFLWRQLGDTQGLAAVLLESGMTAYRKAHLDDAHRLLTESLELARTESGSTLIVAGALLNLGNIARDRQELERAHELFVESLSLARHAGDERRTAAALNNLGNVARIQGNFSEATSFHEETLALRRVLGDRTGIAMSLLNLAETARRIGDFESAATHISESLRLVRDLSDRYTLTECLFVAAAIAGSQERYERAATLLGAAEALRRSMTVSLADMDQESHDSYASAARDALGGEIFGRAVAFGASLPLTAAVDYALADTQ